MSKKNLLNEQTIRRFGGLAGIKPATTSNFLQEEEVEFEEEEVEFETDPLAGDEEAVLDAEVELDAAEDDLEADLEGEVDITDEDADVLIALGKKLEAAQGEEVVDLEVDDLEVDDVDEFAVEDEVDLEVEEEPTLEEMINSILQEDDDDDDIEQGDSKAAEDDAKAAARAARNEGRIQVVDDEYLMKEVSRRVKQRLAKLVKEQRRPQRVRKRKK